jgi:hypothetical protein
MYAGHEWHGRRIESVLMKSRMVQGTYDGLNPATAARWAYPDIEGAPTRNTSEMRSLTGTKRMLISSSF